MLAVGSAANPNATTPTIAPEPSIAGSETNSTELIHYPSDHKYTKVTCRFEVNSNRILSFIKRKRYKITYSPKRESKNFFWLTNEQNALN